MVHITLCERWTVDIEQVTMHFAHHEQWNQAIKHYEHQLHEQ